MECTEKAIDGFGVVHQAEVESVLLIAGWMGDNLLKKTGTRRGGRAKKKALGFHNTHEIMCVGDVLGGRVEQGFVM